MDGPYLEHRYLRVDGHRIAYLEQGYGPPVLLLHGIPTSSLLWRNVIPGLSRAHRVVAPDLLNFGKSDKPRAANVSIEAQSRMLIGFMDALGIHRADVVAHDIGGGIAQILAVNHPERINRLVLADSVCFDSWPIPDFKPLQEPEAEQRMSPDELEQMLRDSMLKTLHDDTLATPELGNMIVEPWQGEEGKLAFFRNLRRLNPEYTLAIADELKQLPHETLVLWGRHDPFQLPEYAEKLKATLPNSSIAWVDAAHWITEECPEEIADIVGRFLEAR
ncbi:pimeloyl-ACP methyl ester carboxylesterase [Modicisalibacter xianhensis]|uniref:Pimeloyl-ACP methyl ester carboxylesterase n=1 Tax=Modicisalibacter xianhensis TaxID=442341 RepID=A0A4R8FJI6_9GAMM|nr:alpha/beta fold hydrolase [Halomonas xianhensis]TDX23825.1 pimeloyl-ACP methyl ester carboxylesterase [Halomonas xianhensis]